MTDAGVPGTDERQRATIERLYSAFGRRDGDAMAECYTPDATFEDPVFTVSGGDVGDMWRMLTSRGEGELKLTYRITAPDRARWVAEYVFGGHPVRNEVQSSFTFAPDGRIAEQVDRFDFPRWAGQALGLKGKLLGRFSFFQAGVRKSVGGILSGWQARRDEEAGLAGSAPPDEPADPGSPPAG